MAASGDPGAIPVNSMDKDSPAESSNFAVFFKKIPLFLVFYLYKKITNYEYVNKKDILPFFTI
jgi:hypothetical protein